MRFLMVLMFLGFVLTSCQKKESFSWLEGDWQRIDEQEHRETFESWKLKDGIYTGFGLTISQGDTIFSEVMTLQEIDGSWALKVSGVNEAPTVFVFTDQSATSFTCENQENEFPKVIKYFSAGDTLMAEISNEEMSLDFAFLKKK